MRTVLIVTAFLGLAAMGKAQIGPVEIKMDANGPMTIHADSMSDDGNVRHLKGSVEIVVGNLRFRANEVDVSSVTPAR
jgi:lipopolysaccharide export system protein LptA